MISAELRAQMLSGEMYNDLLDELVQAREQAVHRADEYNRSFGQPSTERTELLRHLLRGVGKGAHFEPVFRCEFGSNIVLGNNFYANFDCVMLDGAPITIGDNVLFGPRVSIYTSNHAADAEERVAGGCYARPVSVGDNTWIGGGVTVNPGVSIGRNAIIGSGSVVTRSVPDNCLAAGVPARVIREITAADKTDYAP